MSWRLWKKPDPGPLEGEAARERAERALRQTKAETPKYAALGDQLRQIREENHLTELFYAIHRGDG